MRAAIYARVSTDDQAERQKPIEDQLQECERYCREQGWEIVGEWTDPGISGTRDERPGLDALMQSVGQQAVDRVVVWTFSRLARSTDLFHYLCFLLRKAGAMVVAVDQASASNLETDIHAAIDAEFVRRIQRDVRRAIRGRVTRRERIGGRDILGYCWTGKNTREVVPEEAALVRRIFEMADPAGECRQFAAIGRRFGMRRTRIHRILTNPVYAGAYVSGMSKMVDGKAVGIPRPKWSVQWGAHEAIVDRALFQRVQERVRQQAEASRTGRNAGRSRLALSDLLLCPKCGKRLSLSSVGRTKGGPILYYACRVGSPEGPDRMCDGTRPLSIKGWTAALVLDLFRHLQKREFIEILAEEVSRILGTGRRIGSLESEVKRLRRAEETLLAVMASGEVKDPARIAREYDSVREMLRRTESELQQARAQGQSLTSAEAIQERLQRVCDALEQCGGRLDVDHLARPVLHSLIESITPSEDRTTADVRLRSDALLGIPVSSHSPPPPALVVRWARAAPAGRAPLATADHA